MEGNFRGGFCLCAVAGQHFCPVCFQNCHLHILPSNKQRQLQSAHHGKISAFSRILSDCTASVPYTAGTLTAAYPRSPRPPLPPHTRDHRAYPFSLRTLTAIVPRLRPLWGYPEPPRICPRLGTSCTQRPPTSKIACGPQRAMRDHQFPTGDVRIAKTPAQARYAIQTE